MVYQLPKYPVNCRPILCELPPYPTNHRPVLPTAALSCKPPPYPTSCRPILPTSALSCTNHPPIRCQTPPYPAKRRPIQCDLPPCPVNCRPILNQPPRYPVPSAALLWGFGVRGGTCSLGGRPRPRFAASSFAAIISNFCAGVWGFRVQGDPNPYMEPIAQHA